MEIMNDEFLERLYTGTEYGKDILALLSSKIRIKANPY